MTQRRDTDLVFQQSGTPGDGAPESFNDQLRESMKRAPWFAVSIGFHAILFLVIGNIVWVSKSEAQEHAIIAEALPESVDVIEEVPPPPEQQPEEQEQPKKKKAKKFKAAPARRSSRRQEGADVAAN